MAAELRPPKRPSRREAIRSTLDRTKVGNRSLSWYLSGWRLGVLILVLLILFPLSPTATGPLMNTAISVGIYVMLAIGLNMVVGYAGLLDLGYVAFFVIGAYTLAAGTFGAIQKPDGTLVTTPTFSFWLLLPAGALIAGIFGILLGAPTLRLRGDYLAIVTLGFGEIVPLIFQNLSYFQGNTGISASPPPDINGPLGVISFSDPLDRAPFYYLVLTFAVLVILASRALRDSSLGRAWVAIREDETAASSSGVNLVRTKLLAFALGATIGGIGGVIQAAFTPAVEPTQFSFQISITVLIMIVLGGLGSIPGVIVGAVILRSIDVYLLGIINDAVHQSPIVAAAGSPLHFLAAVNFNTSKYLIYGIILVLMILLRPQGLIPDVRRRRELHGIGAAVEGTSAVGMLVREEEGEAAGELGAEDATAYAGPGADDIGRGS
jgi:ABC-type branched-subunit amino acid transport system permease subunit